MKNEFLEYEDAIALKELGYNEKSLAYWFNETPLNPEGQCLVYYEKPYLNVKITSGIIKEYCWAPLYQQAFRWFRDNHKLYNKILVDQTTEPKFCFGISKFIGNPSDLSEREWDWENIPNDDSWGLYRKYEEAELACLKKLIEIVKNKNK